MKKMLYTLLLLNVFTSTLKSTDDIRTLLYYCNYGYDYPGIYNKEYVESFIVNSKYINFQVENPKNYGYKFKAKSTPLHVAICSLGYWDGDAQVDIQDFSDFCDGKAKKEELDKLALYNSISAQRRFKTICILLDNPNIDVNLQDEDGDTPLIKTVRFDLLGDIRYLIARLLLMKGTSVTQRNNVGLNFLYYAARDPKLYSIYSEIYPPEKADEDKLPLFEAMDASECVIA